MGIAVGILCNAKCSVSDSWTADATSQVPVKSSLPSGWQVHEIVFES